MVNETNNPARSSTCGRTVGPSGLTIFTRITSWPVGPGYSNEWPLGPKEMPFAIAISTSDAHCFPVEHDRFLRTIIHNSPEKNPNPDGNGLASSGWWLGGCQLFRPNGPFVRIAQPIGLGFGPPPTTSRLKGRPFVRFETEGSPVVSLRVRQIQMGPRSFVEDPSITVPADWLLVYETSHPARSSTCGRTVGPSGLTMFTRITSWPVGPGYSNEWPLGPKEMPFAIAVSASNRHRLLVDDD